MRHSKKDGGRAEAPQGASANANANASAFDANPFMPRTSSALQDLPDYLRRGGAGPYSPDSVDAQRSDVDSCRKCGWYSRKDCAYCQKCGRLGWKSSYRIPEQSVAYDKTERVCLGTRTMNFTILSRDVRSMRKYKASWTAGQASADQSNDNANDAGAWVYDECEMEGDVFKHRLGPRPTISSITKLLSCYSKDRLKEMAKQNQNQITEEQLDAIFLEDHNDWAILKQLECVYKFGKKPTLNSKGEEIMDEYDIGGDILATWDEESRSGVS